VSGLDAFERYQRDDAWTWEHQSLLRARAVVGEPGIRQTFESLRRKILTDYTKLSSLVDDVRAMRGRMKSELDRSTRDRFDLKQGDGGVADLEFIVQFLCLREAREHPRVIEFSDNVRQIDALTDCAVLSANLGLELKEIYLSYRREVHRRVLDSRNLLIPAADFQNERAAVISAWEALLR
jgi:glutamate-ammonia-ligase adenylyltransferase